jgi:hypothetical protein
MYLLGEGGVEDPVLPEKLPEPHSAAEDPTKGHVLPKNDLWEASQERGGGKGGRGGGRGGRGGGRGGRGQTPPTAPVTAPTQSTVKQSVSTLRAVLRWTVHRNGFGEELTESTLNSPRRPRTSLCLGRHGSPTRRWHAPAIDASFVNVPGIPQRHFFPLLSFLFLPFHPIAGQTDVPHFGLAPKPFARRH